MAKTKKKDQKALILFVDEVYFKYLLRKYVLKNLIIIFLDGYAMPSKKSSNNLSFG